MAESKLKSPLFQWIADAGESCNNFNFDKRSTDKFDDLIDQFLKFDDQDRTDRGYLILCHLYMKLHLIYCTMTLSDSAKKYCQDCIEILSKQFPSFDWILDDLDIQDKSLQKPLDVKLRAPFSLILISMYNEFGHFKTGFVRRPSFLQYLKQSERIHHDWKKQNPRPPLVEFQDLIDLDPSIQTLKQITENVKCQTIDEKRLDYALLTTCECLASLYHDENNGKESAYYCFESLRLHYLFLADKRFPRSYDHIEWALHAATLSQYYAEKRQFDLARQMIACSRKVLHEADPELQMNEPDTYKKADADLDRIEVKYCLMLLDESFKNLKQFKENPNAQLEAQLKQILLNDDKQPVDIALPTYPAKDYDQARKVFQYALSMIERAKKFFTINERCSDYIDCVFDHNEIYRSMIPFIEEIDSRCKMMKRRIDLLEGVLNEINPDYYLPYCRKLLYELGDLYYQQVDLKLCQHKIQHYGELEKTDLQSMKKIMSLINKSMISFYKFLSSFEYLNTEKVKTHNGKKIKVLPSELLNIDVKNMEPYPLPEKIDDRDYIQPILFAYLKMAKLFGKKANVNKKMDENYQKICLYHKELRSYLDRNEQQRKKNKNVQEIYEILLNIYDDDQNHQMKSLKKFN